MVTLSQSILNHSLRLGAFAVFAAFLLSITNSASKERIAEQKQAAERRALSAVLPPTQHTNDLLNDVINLSQDSNPFENFDLLGLTKTRNGYLARMDNRISGFILPVTAHDGYSGDITLLVGINSDGSVSGVRVLTHRETPGLGDKIDLRVSDWILNFSGHSLTNPAQAQWHVKKDGGTFDQFVGATVTPRAVVKAVKNALLFYRQNQDLLMQTQNTE